MTNVKKVHIYFENGMIMIWMKKGETLDELLAKGVVEEAGFTLSDFEPPE